MKELIFALIPAAGSSSRMNTSVSKQLIELCDIPVLIRTLMAFDASPLIDGIVVSARLSEQKQILALVAKYKISKLIGIAKGGGTRQDSVRSGLNLLLRLIKSEHDDSPPCPENSYVLIHDGARPFVTEQMISESIRCVKHHKACVVGVPVKDTIKKIASQESADGCRMVLETLERDCLRAVQTPQSFSLSLIRNLHRRAFQDGLVFTDDASLAEHYGRRCALIDGDYANIKITTPEDIYLGELILRSRK